MKKIYNKPEMETLVIKSQNSLLAGSLGKGEGNINPGDVGAPSYDFEE
jgi:hypothetical protein